MVSNIYLLEYIQEEAPSLWVVGFIIKQLLTVRILLLKFILNLSSYSLNLLYHLLHSGMRELISDFFYAVFFQVFEECCYIPINFFS